VPIEKPVKGANLALSKTDKQVINKYTGFLNLIRC
jgi:hypothetical protein